VQVHHTRERAGVLRVEPAREQVGALDRHHGQFRRAIAERLVQHEPGEGPLRLTRSAPAHMQVLAECDDPGLQRERLREARDREVAQRLGRHAVHGGVRAHVVQASRGHFDGREAAHFARQRIGRRGRREDGGVCGDSGDDRRGVRSDGEQRGQARVQAFGPREDPERVMLQGPVA